MRADRLDRLEARVADELLGGDATVHELTVYLYETRDHIEDAVNSLVERGEAHIAGKRKTRGRPESVFAITRTRKAA